MKKKILCVYRLLKENFIKGSNLVRTGITTTKKSIFVLLSDLLFLYYRTSFSKNKIIFKERDFALMF